MCEPGRLCLVYLRTFGRRPRLGELGVVGGMESERKSSVKERRRYENKKEEQNYNRMVLHSEMSLEFKTFKEHNMWYDQGKWITCRKISIPSFLHHFLITSQIGYLRICQCWKINKKNKKQFLPISQKQYIRHPTHSCWSCHILPKNYTNVTHSNKSRNKCYFT